MSSVVGATTSAAHRITMSPIWVSPCYSFTWLAINRYTWDRFGLMTMIQTAVENMHQLDQILPAVRDLGRRHAGYGVKAADYNTVAGALLGTLEQALGSEFTSAVRNAWIAYYQTLAGEMKAAASV